MDDSDDDCQLYTRAAENIGIKLKNFQEQRDQFEKVINLVPDEEVEHMIEKVNFSNPSANFNTIENVILNISESDSDDDMPIAELSRKLRSRKKRPNKSPIKKPKNSKRKSSRKSSRTSRAAARDLGVIVLDDDTGYCSVVNPIDFNSRSNRKTKQPNGNDSVELVSDITISSILDNDSEDECFISDASVTVIVEWNNGQRITRKQFNLNRYQKLQTVFEELAEMEGLPTSRILLMHDYNSVSPLDTPSSLNFKFYGALTGSVTATDINHDKLNLNTSEQDEICDGIKVKLQLESRQTLLLTIKKNERMHVLYRKCAEELGIKFEDNKIKIMFDGEYVQPTDLLSDLDAEDGDLFHVLIKT